MINNRCGSMLRVGDDHGDNSAGFRCQRAEGHKGPHYERWHALSTGNKPVLLKWYGDDRERCGGCEALVAQVQYCSPCRKELCKTCFAASEERYSFFCASCRKLGWMIDENGEEVRPVSEQVSKGDQV